MLYSIVATSLAYYADILSIDHGFQGSCEVTPSRASAAYAVTGQKKVCLKNNILATPQNLPDCRLPICTLKYLLLGLRYGRGIQE